MVDEPADESPMLRSARIETGQSLDEVQPDILYQIVKVRLGEARFADDLPGFTHDESPSGPRGVS